MMTDIAIISEMWRLLEEGGMGQGVAVRHEERRVGVPKVHILIYFHSLMIFEFGK